MDLILTSSQHSKNVLANTSYEAENKQTGEKHEMKITTPVEVLIEGANLDVYHPLTTGAGNTDLNFDISHGRPPDDAPEDAVHILEIHGQR